MGLPREGTDVEKSSLKISAAGKAHKKLDSLAEEEHRVLHI